MFDPITSLFTHRKRLVSRTSAENARIFSLEGWRFGLARVLLLVSACAIATKVLSVYLWDVCEVFVSLYYRQTGGKGMLLLLSIALIGFGFFTVRIFLSNSSVRFMGVNSRIWLAFAVVFYCGLPWGAHRVFRENAITQKNIYYNGKLYHVWIDYYEDEHEFVANRRSFSGLSWWVFARTEDPEAPVPRDAVEEFMLEYRNQIPLVSGDLRSAEIQQQNNKVVFRVGGVAHVVEVTEPRSGVGGLNLQILPHR